MKHLTSARMTVVAYGLALLLAGFVFGALFAGCAKPKPVEPPAWKWSAPYYDPNPPACGAGGKACG